jgi:hypothetical protein
MNRKELIEQFKKPGTLRLALGELTANEMRVARATVQFVISRLPKPFQELVAPWMEQCFGPKIASDVTERNHRFLEEALELVQACDCTREEAHLLVDYVFNRPVGEKSQEVGGVMVTLAALCNAQDLSMNSAARTELARCWKKIDAIRAKQAQKPKNSPLPV